MLITDLVMQCGIQVKRETVNGEFSGPCPACGTGNDRLRLWPFEQGKSSKFKGRFWCRQCDKKGDFGDLAQLLGYTLNEAAELAGIEITKDKKYAQENSLIPARKSESFTPEKLVAPPELWIEKATTFTEWAHENLLNQTDQIETLKARGILLDIIKQYKIGWNPEDVFRSRESWGLEKEKNEDGGDRKLWLPRGIVIPSLNNLKTVRLKIRRDGNFLDKKYIAISGSMNGLKIYGNKKLKTLVVVESELDALALLSAAADLIFVIAIGGSKKNPDNVSDDYVKSVNRLLISHDNDSVNNTGIAVFDKWKNLYPYAQAIPVPIALGKDIGEAAQKGFNLREWLLNFIPARQEIKQVDLIKNIIVAKEEPLLSAQKILQIFPGEITEISKAEYLKNAKTPSKKEKEIVDWSLDMKELINQFYSSQKLPQEPFQLRSDLYVSDPTQFYSSIKESINEGPSGKNAKSLEHILRILFCIIESNTIISI